MAGAEERIPVRFHIKKADLDRRGYSATCPGCKAILRGTARHMHTEVCRARLTEAMGG